MKKLIAWSLGLLAHGIWAQWGPWTEDWSGGLSAWQGDTAAFAAGAELRLAAPGAGTYALWRTGLGARPAQASGQVRLDFNPSSSNFAFWEVLDTAGSNQSQPVPAKGYRLEFGRTNDQLRLLRLPDGFLLANSPSALLDRAASVVSWTWTWDAAAGHRLAWTLRDTLGVFLDSGSVWGNADSSVRHLGRLRVGATVTSTRVRALRWGPTAFGASKPTAGLPVRPARRGDLVVTEILVAPEPRVHWRGAPGDFVELYVAADSAVRASGWSFSHGTGRWALPERVLLPGQVAVLADGRLAWPDSLNLWNAPLSLTSSPAFWRLEDHMGRTMAWGRTQPDMHHPFGKSSGGWSLEAPAELSALPRAWQSSRSAWGSSPGWLQSSPVGPRTGGILSVLADSVLHIDWRHPLPLDTPPWYPFDSAAISVHEGGRWVPNRSSCERTDLRWLPFAGGNLWPGFPGGTFELPLLPFWQHADGTPGDCTHVYAGWAIPPDSGDLEVAEVLLNPLPGEGRFVELRNRSSVVVDLSALFWTNGASSGGTSDSLVGSASAWRRVAVPGRFLLPGGVMFGAADPSAVLRRYPAGDSAAGPRGAERPGAWVRPAPPGGPGATSHSIPLTDAGGILELRRSDGLRIDWAEVRPDQFPKEIRQSPGKGEGMSLERRGPDPQDWGLTRIDSATPGRWPLRTIGQTSERFTPNTSMWPPQLAWDLAEDRAWLMQWRWTDPEGRSASPWSTPRTVAPQDSMEALERPPFPGIWLWEFRFIPSEGRQIRRSYLVTSN